MSLLRNADPAWRPQNARMSGQPLTRDAWVADFVHELIRLRPDLTYSFKYATGYVDTCAGSRRSYSFLTTA
jgi:hypothetical protein